MILMSVDVESWVHRQVFNIPLSEQTKELDGGHVLSSTRLILDLFRKYRTRATFFILGTVAEWYPELVKEILNGGHEVGIHGYTHTRLCDHSRESFDEEIKKTVSVLRSMGAEPRGYRAPAFTRADFMYDVLLENGLSYDSSVFPVKTPLYDGTSFSGRPFVTENGIIEIPCSVLKIGNIRIPAGGFYLRLFGARLNQLLFREIHKRNGVAVMYLHPWEIMSMPEKISAGGGAGPDLPFVKRKFAYYRIPMLNELEYLVDNLDFTNFEGAGEYINEKLLGQ